MQTDAAHQKNMAQLVSGADTNVILHGNAVPRATNGERAAGVSSSNEPALKAFQDIFGPQASHVWDDERFRRKKRPHLPDVLKGPNYFMQDRVDGLITDATNSPFTTVILPYLYNEEPDGKLKWTVPNFDEGLASRVPYEAAARTLTQSQEKFKSYLTRHGLAITMEHNFMMSEAGRRNFGYQLQQLVGSIQKTNNLNVHVALLRAPSYLRKIREKYYRDLITLEDDIRQYVNTFGFLQKNMNGLDILIEDGKQLLRGWGGKDPNFLLINSKLTFQLQMNPERTQYITQGPDGVRRLAQGPDIRSYRGINIVHSHSFSMEEGSQPRDLLRRRVRVAEFYLLPDCANGPAGAAPASAMSDLSRGGAGAGVPSADRPAVTVEAGTVRLYDESSDSFISIKYEKIAEQCKRFIERANRENARRHNDGDPLKSVVIPETWGSVLLLRPNIEHHMFSMIMGKGGLDDLGATMWGQTELSCFDDGQHGVWGMSYKYHASSIVFQERNMLRMYDIAYDGYSAGKDATILDWASDADVNRFVRADNNLAQAYNGPSIVVIPLASAVNSLPSPLPLGNLRNFAQQASAHQLVTADLFVEDMQGFIGRVEDRIGSEHKDHVFDSISVAYDLLNMHRNSAAAKCAAMASLENECTVLRVAYSGTYQHKLDKDNTWTELYGCGHHGPDMVGKASERNGKGMRTIGMPQAMRIV